MNTKLLNTDTTFTLTADSGELEWQAHRLVKSLRESAPKSDIVVFIPSNSVSDMSEDVLEYFDVEAEVVLGEMPLPDYPISAFLQAFVEGCERASTEYVVALDTDVVALQTPEIELHSPNDEVWVRPADVGAQYWGSQESLDDWGAMCDHFNLPRFTSTQSDFVTSCVDRRPIPPYWNSGVVVTRDKSLANDWLDITIELTESDLPIDEGEFFLDQISLALATRLREIRLFGVQMNYPLGGFARVPEDVKLLHYGDTRNLARISNRGTREKLYALDAMPSVGPYEFALSLFDLVSFKSGYFLSWSAKQTLNRLLGYS